MAGYRYSLGYWGPQKEPIASQALYWRWDTAAGPLSLIETVSSTNDFFAYKSDEWTLRMDSKTFRNLLLSDILNKLATWLILLSIIIDYSAHQFKNDRQPGYCQLIKPSIARKGRQAPRLEYRPTCASPSGKMKIDIIWRMPHKLTRIIACCSRRPKLWKILLTRKPEWNSVS